MVGKYIYESTSLNRISNIFSRGAIYNGQFNYFVAQVIFQLQNI